MRKEMNEEEMVQVNGADGGNTFALDIISEALDDLFGKKKGEPGSVIEIRGPKIPETVKQ